MQSAPAPVVQRTTVPLKSAHSSRKSDLVPHFPNSNRLNSEHAPVRGAVVPFFPPSSTALVAVDVDGDAERDSRTDIEWTFSVLDYLEFRSGNAWRRGRQQHRTSARYWEYTEAIRLIRERMYTEEAPCNCAAHCLPVYGHRSLKPIPALPMPYPGDRFFKTHPHLEPRFNSRKEYIGTAVKETAPAAHDENFKHRSEQLRRQSMKLFRQILAAEEAGQPTEHLRELHAAKKREIDALVAPAQQQEAMYA